MIRPSVFSRILFCFLFLWLSCVCPASGQTRFVQNDIQHDVSLPLRDLVKIAPGPSGVEPREAEELRVISLPSGFKPAEEPDAALQRIGPQSPTLLAPTIGLNFDGIGQGVFGFGVRFAPPDTNGAVGLTQYVQWVNVNFAVFDKTSGNVLLGPVAGNSLWTGFGGPCETNNDGDPIVIYDKLNDRWVFGQFAVRSATGFLTNSLQCVAVSTTSDATGTFNRYAFQYNNKFDDYPKMAVWPDAYYATFNIFDSLTSAFLGADACSYDGNAMRNAQPATQVCFQQASSVGSLLPSDVDGHTPPPAGSPNFMIDFGVNSLNLYKFHVDFTTPANSTFTGPTSIPVSPFTPLCNGGRGCVPQQGTGTQLDSLADRLMYRLAYRNFGDHESLVVNHSVAVGGTAFSGSGVRWYELRDPSGTPTVAQQSTYAPDSNFRWMGSIAMDGSGDIALGYSVSSSSMFPSIAITGRCASDTPGSLGTENVIINGTGSQSIDAGGNALTRWGDYSAMQVDPSDDSTFWYTTEYLKGTGVFNWNTRIANFKLPATLTDLTVAGAHNGNLAQGQTGQIFTITANDVGCKASDGTTVTVTDTLPAGLSATAISGTGWNCNLPTLTCTRSDSLGASAAFPAIKVTVNVADSAPASVTNTVTISGGGDQNAGNNTSSDSITINPSPDLTVGISHAPNPFTVAQSGTYTIVVTNSGHAPTAGTVNVSDLLPQGVTVTAISGTGWNCSGTTSVNCTRFDALAAGASYPSIALTVNVAGGGASVTNAVSVSGGGEFDTGDDTANDQATILPVAIAPGSNTPVTATAGTAGSFSLTVNLSTGQTVGTITFSASGLPPNSKAAFSPPSLTQAGPVTLTIDTSGNGHTAALLPPMGFEPVVPYLAGLFVACALWRIRKAGRTRRRLWLTTSACALMPVLLCAGCGGGSSTPPPPVTPSGTYTIMVTASSSNQSIGPVSTPVTLIVK